MPSNGDISSDPPPPAPAPRPRVRLDTTDLGSVRTEGSRPRRRRGLSGLGALAAFLALAAVGSSFLTVRLHSMSRVGSTAPVGPAQQAVIFVISGATASDLNGRNLRNIRALRRSGVSYARAWLGQLGGQAAADASIGTGVLPSHHGVVGAGWRDPGSGTVQHAFGRSMVQLGTLDQVMESHSSTPLSYALKSQRPASKIASVGGTPCGAEDALGTWVADFVLCPQWRAGHWLPGAVTGHAPPQLPSWQARSSRRGLAGKVEHWLLGAEDAWVSRYAVWTMRHLRPRLLTVRFSELGQLAPFCPEDLRSSVTRTLLAGVDRDIGVILRESRHERRYKQTVFVVTSDSPVSSLSLRFSLNHMRDVAISAGGQPVYTEGGGVATMALRDRLQGQPVAQALAGGSLQAVDGMYYRTKSGAGWTYSLQYLNPNLPPGYSSTMAAMLRTLASASAPDLVTVYHPGAGATGLHAGPYQQTGTATGLQWPQQHIPLIVSGDGVPRGARSTYPARLVDLQPTIAALLQLNPPPGDGIVLSDAMQSAPSGTDRLQADRGSLLNPIVRSLQQRGNGVS